MTNSGKNSFKIKKPYSKYFMQLIDCEVVYINKRERAAGNYFKRLTRGHRAKIPDVAGVIEIPDRLILYKKNPFNVVFPGQKYDYFSRLRRQIRH